MGHVIEEIKSNGQTELIIFNTDDEFHDWMHNRYEIFGKFPVYRYLGNQLDLPTYFED